jgi:hypothetical protein
MGKAGEGGPPRLIRSMTESPSEPAARLALSASALAAFSLRPKGGGDPFGARVVAAGREALAPDVARLVEGLADLEVDVDRAGVLEANSFFQSASTNRLHRKPYIPWH